MSIAKSVKKSVPKGLKPFKPGPDPRRGHGPAKGAPNAGRPPSIVTEIARAAFASRIPVLTDIADGEPVQKIEVPGPNKSIMVGTVSAAPSDRIRALGLLARVGRLDGGDTSASAQLETPEGFKFTLKLGERLDE